MSNLVRMLITWTESLTYDMERGTRKPIKLSTNGYFSVRPLLPETIGLPGCFSSLS